jgi:hypothetical protein
MPSLIWARLRGVDRERRIDPLTEGLVGPTIEYPFEGRPGPPP